MNVYLGPCRAGGSAADTATGALVGSLASTTMSNGAPNVLDSLRGDDLITVTRRQQIFGGAVLNILVNVVVLNLFVEFAD